MGYVGFVDGGDGHRRAIRAGKGNHMQPVAFQPVTIGWIIAILVLILAIIFAIIGLPDPKVVLLLIAGLAVARLL